MSLLNRLVGGIVDGFLFPFRSLPAIVGLAVLSLVIGVVMLIVFKATSDQKRIAVVKGRIQACFYEIRLFNDSLAAILRAQAEVLRHNLTYLRLSLVPLFWMIIPFVLILGQLHFRYGYDGLRPGAPTIVKVTLADDWAQRPEIEWAGTTEKPPVNLEMPPGIRVETDGVWMSTLHEMAWRISATEPGRHVFSVEMAGERYTKEIVVSDRVTRRSPKRVQAGVWRQLIDPVESPLPGSAPIRAIAIAYPEARFHFLGVGLHWMVVFFVLSMAFAFALKGRFGVTI